MQAIRPQRLDNEQLLEWRRLFSDRIRHGLFAFTAFGEFRPRTSVFQLQVLVQGGESGLKAQILYIWRCLITKVLPSAEL